MFLLSRVNVASAVNILSSTSTSFGGAQQIDEKLQKQLLAEEEIAMKQFKVSILVSINTIQALTHSRLCCKRFIQVENDKVEASSQRDFAIIVIITKIGRSKKKFSLLHTLFENRKKGLILQLCERSLKIRESLLTFNLTNFFTKFFKIRSQSCKMRLFSVILKNNVGRLDFKHHSSTLDQYYFYALLQYSSFQNFVLIRRDLCSRRIQRLPTPSPQPRSPQRPTVEPPTFWTSLEYQDRQQRQHLFPQLHLLRTRPPTTFYN